MTKTAWRTWFCCTSFASSGQGCVGRVCCCKVKAGRPTAVPDTHEFWKDNDKCDCNLLCCGYQARSNTVPVVTTTVPAGQTAYTAPPTHQHFAPVSQGTAVGHPAGPATQQAATFPEPVKPGTTTYPTVQ